MAIKIQILAEDKATPIVNKALDNTKKKGSEAAGKIGNSFRDVFENVSQNATGAFGSVAGGLFKLPGPAGIAVGAILGIVGALGAMALKSAQATAATNTDSAKFLATIEKLKNGIGGVVDFIGSAVIPIFNALADVFGVAATQQETLLAQSKAYHDSLIADAKAADDFTASLREYLTVLERQDEIKLQNELVKAFVSGDQASSAAIRNRINLLAILRLETKKIAEDTKTQTIGEKKRIEDNTEDLEKLSIFQEKSEQAHQALVISGLNNIGALKRIQFAADKVETKLRTEEAKQLIALQEATAKRQLEIGTQIFISISQNLAAAVFEGEKLGKVLENILKQLATRSLAKLIFGGLSSLFGGGIFGGLGKLIGFQHGGEFTVDGSSGIDQNLVAFRATRGERVRITPAGQSTVNNVSNTPNISINVNARNFDRNFVRTELVPLINREVKNGLDLFASKIK